MASLKSSARLNMRTERAFIYCHQSTTSGAGQKSVSLASQERMLRDLAAERGFAVVGVEIDADIRGWKDERERPGLAGVYARVEAGEFDVLLVYDLSRLARMLRIQENVIHAIEKHGARVVSLMEPWLEDSVIRQMFGAMSEYRTKELAAHTSRAASERARRGLHHGPAPYGYVKSSPKEPLALDMARLDRADVVREMFERIANGDTATEITADLNERSVPNSRGRRWTLATVRKMIETATYRGAVAVGDVVVESAHPAIVEPELWQRANDRLHGPTYHRKRRKPVSYKRGRGQTPYFRCLYASTRERQEGYGRPACDEWPKSRAAHLLEEEAWSAVARDLSRIIDPESAIAQARAEYERMVPDAARLRREIESALTKLDAQFERAEEMYLDGSRPRAWLNKREAEIASDRLALRDRLEALPPEPDIQAITDAAVILRNLSEELPAFSDENRRLIMARVGMVTYGSSGACIWYAPEIAALIPNARSLAPRACLQSGWQRAALPRRVTGVRSF